MNTHQHPTKKLLPWLSLALIMVALDQITKFMVVEHFALGDSQTITSFFNLVRAHNQGAAFSFLDQAGGWQRWLFTGLGCAASVFIVIMLKRQDLSVRLHWALTLILGGAVGNVIDRLHYGHVIDFLQVHGGGYFFPSFNVADSAITLGAILLIVDELFKKK